MRLPGVSMSSNVAGQVPEAGPDICTTSEAARLLGVSNTTIQIMVERGELQAWRTRGGHRRINRESVEALRQMRNNVSRPGAADSAAGFAVLVVEDDPELLQLYGSTLESWPLDLRVLMAADGLDALLSIERHRPDLLITDLAMGPMDGFELLRRLRSYPEFDVMSIIAVTGLDEQAIAARGGLPRGVIVYPKPVPFEKLQGFIEAGVLRKQLEKT